MFARLASLLKLVAAVLLVLALIDLAVFRSGAYARLIEPESTAGPVLGSVYAARHLRDPARKNVLVFGNSQIGEGFSARTADEASGRPDLHFINASVPGTSPRVWNYILREVDPNGDRFAAVALMVPYDTFGIRVDPANYPLDTSYTLPLLRASDLGDFPASFHAADQRERARRAILFPLQAMREDFLAFLANPPHRLRKARKYWPGWLGAVQQWHGHDQSIPAMEIDPASGQPVSWDGCSTELIPHLRDYFGALHNANYGTPELQAQNNAYLREWISRIAQRYRAHGVPVIVFVVPRGPWHKQLAPVPSASGAIAELRDADDILTLPGDAFVELEQPQYFFDQLHMNHEGQQKFSKMFAAQVAPLVH